MPYLRGMALKSFTIQCDHCLAEGDDGFAEVSEALDSGWFIVQGPDYMIGADEKTYCCLDCLQADL